MKFKKPLIALTLTATAVLAVAAPTKKELVQKVLTLQQPDIETLGYQIVDQPARAMMQSAEQALQSQVPPEKRDAAAKAVQADIKKYVDEAHPLVKDRVTKLAPSTIGAKLEASFSEDELKQLISWLESPVNKKFRQMQPELAESLGKTLAADLSPTMEPKIKALYQAIAKDLGIAPPAAAAPAPAASPAKK